MSLQLALIVTWDPFHISGSNMALLINDGDMQYHHIHATWLILLDHSYLTNPDYLVVKVWVATAIQYSDITILTG